MDREMNEFLENGISNDAIDELHNLILKFSVEFKQDYDVAKQIVLTWLAGIGSFA